MDEYIKREDALDAVLFALVGTGHQSKAIYAIREFPTEDVVPKSEVEEIVKFKDMAYAELKSLFIEAKQEVAKQIFEEIEKLQNPQGAVWLFTSNYIELKKKYIGE